MIEGRGLGFLKSFYPLLVWVLFACILGLSLEKQSTAHVKPQPTTFEVKIVK